MKSPPPPPRKMACSKLIFDSVSFELTMKMSDELSALLMFFPFHPFFSICISDMIDLWTVLYIRTHIKLKPELTSAIRTQTDPVKCANYFFVFSYFFPVPFTPKSMIWGQRRDKRGKIKRDITTFSVKRVAIVW